MSGASGATGYFRSSRFLFARRKEGAKDVMKRIVALLTMASLVTAMLLLAGTTTAKQTEAVTVEVGPTAKLIGDGQAVQVKIKFSCEPPAEVLEALVTVHQDEGAAFGEGFLGSSAVCDGRQHVDRVEVQALDSTFHSGEAFVSGFVLVCLDAECVETAQGQDTRVVRVVGSQLRAAEPPRASLFTELPRR
jgi:hypothetical protein